MVQHKIATCDCAFLNPLIQYLLPLWALEIGGLNWFCSAGVDTPPESECHIVQDMSPAQSMKCNIHLGVLHMYILLKLIFKAWQTR